VPASRSKAIFRAAAMLIVRRFAGEVLFESATPCEKKIQSASADAILQLIVVAPKKIYPNAKD